MQKLDVFKYAARFVVGSGTMTISNAIIRNNVTADSMPQRISIAVASLVIASIASEATREHTDRRIDGVVEMWNKSNEPTEDPTPAT